MMDEFGNYALHESCLIALVNPSTPSSFHLYSFIHIFLLHSISTLSFIPFFFLFLTLQSLILPSSHLWFSFIHSSFSQSLNLHPSTPPSLNLSTSIHPLLLLSIFQPPSIHFSFSQSLNLHPSTPPSFNLSTSIHPLSTTLFRIPQSLTLTLFHLYIFSIFQLIFFNFFFFFHFFHPAFFSH